jgi:hypothetical protein
VTRDYVINGETLVKVKGNGALASSGFPGEAALWELGLASEAVRVVPRFSYQDVHTDDFGPNIPAEVMWMLADVRIEMVLVHYDRAVLDACISEAMGGISFPAGAIAPAGQCLGRGLPLFSSGNHYVSLSLMSPVLGVPWRFPASYLDSSPLIIPLGTERTLAHLSWRAIPYRLPAWPGFNPSAIVNNFRSGAEIVSSGIVLWDQRIDT